MTANDLKYADLMRQRRMDEHTRKMQRAELALKQEAQPFSLAHTQAQTDAAKASASKAAEDAALATAKRAELYTDNPSTYLYAIHGDEIDARNFRSSSTLASGIWGFNAGAALVGDVLENLTGVIGKAVKSGLNLKNIY